MDEFPIALYKAPGPLEIHGAMLDYKVAADADALSAALADGWFLTTPEAIEAHGASEADAAEKAAALAAANAQAAANRPALEEQATALGVKFDGRTSNKALQDRITAAQEP